MNPISVANTMNISKDDKNNPIYNVEKIKIRIFQNCGKFLCFNL